MDADEGIIQRIEIVQTLLYQLVERYYPVFAQRLRREGRCLPAFVEREFDAYLKCGRLKHGFLRVRCTGCHAERLVAFSCKQRGFCPSCGARRMVDTAALLVDDILPHRGIRQWVLSGRAVPPAFSVRPRPGGDERVAGHRHSGNLGAPDRQGGSAASPRKDRGDDV